MFDLNLYPVNYMEKIHTFKTRGSLHTLAHRVAGQRRRLHPPPPWQRRYHSVLTDNNPSLIITVVKTHRCGKHEVLLMKISKLQTGALTLS